MEGIVDKKLVTYKRNRFVHRWWYRVVIWLAAGAVFITTYFLMLPALTVTEDDDPGTTQIVSGNIINDEIKVNNVFPVQAILGYDARYGGDYASKTEEFFKEGGYDVILIHTGLQYFPLGQFFYGANWDGRAPIGLGEEESFPSDFSGLKIDLADWIGIRIECATKDATNSTLSYDYHYVSQISMRGSTRRAEEENEKKFEDHNFDRIMHLANTDTKGFILMVRKTYMDEGFTANNEDRRMYWPACNIKKQTYEETVDDKVHVNQTPLSKLTRKNIGDDNWNWESIYSDEGYLDLNHKKVTGKGVDALAYITFSPYVDQSDDDNAAEDINGTKDEKVVDNFTFKLFDYDRRINMCKEGKRLESTAVEADLRNIAPYFNFRGGTYSTGNTDPWRNYWIRYAACTCKRGSACNSVLHRNDTWDADGFTKYHATVEYDMRNYKDTTLQGYPMLSFTHDAEGKERTPTTEISNLSELSRSLKYLFNGQQAQTFLERPDGDRDRLVGSGKVTEYAAKNTILQYNEDTGEYWYDSAQNAVDYDKAANLFRVRSYRERNELTAAFGLETDDYYDFMPFNYTKGIVSQVFYHDRDEFEHKLNEVSIPFEDPHFVASTSNIMAPHIDSSTPTNANYWFGMTMEFSFIQGKDGTLVHVDSNGNKKPAQDMVFTFSGDDDVWVFIDDVLVLDLGGTHGTVTGSINFSTGEVKQYLDWNKSKETDTETSFPTTLKDCFDRADALTRVEWDSDGEYRFADYTTHTLKFYYLERGQAVANCSIKFNLQSFSDKSLVVEKQLDKETSDNPLADEVLDYLQKTQEYKFRVLKEDQQELLFIAGDKFTKFNTITGETTKDCTVGAYGIFTLKHGEQAIFEDMWEKTGSSDSKIEKYYVQELRPDGQKYQYIDTVQYTLGTASGVVITGEDTGTDFIGYMSSEMSPVETQTVTFKNTVKVDQLYDLKINKTIELIDPARREEYSSKEFSVEVKLDGVPLPVDTTYLVDDTEKRTVQTEGIIKIKADETVTIKGIVAGTTYTVKEVFDNGPAGFVAKYPDVTYADGVTGEINTENNNVTINIKNVQCGAEIPLTISKQLVNATDNSNFTFKFSLYPITKGNDENYIVDNSVNVDIIDITISGNKNNGVVEKEFSLKYLAEDFNEDEDAYLYYVIEETTNDGEKVSIIDYDSTAYVVTVKVNKDAAGNLTAEIVSKEKFKNGDVTDKTTQGNYEIIDGLNGSVEFVNTLNLYSLPATGGSGEKFTASQFALGYVLLVGAVVFLMCCFTDKGRRDDSKKDKP